MLQIDVKRAVAGLSFRIADQASIPLLVSFTTPVTTAQTVLKSEKTIRLLNTKNEYSLART
jgi:hypothetical protein